MNDNIKSKNKISDILKSAFIIIFSLLPLLAVIAFIVWRCMKAKGKTNAEIRDLLFKIHGITIIAVLILSIIIAFFATGGFSDKNKDAWICAQIVVSDELKSPNTADFCNYTSAKITNTGGNRYIVKGYVDSENGFGATVRTHFTVTLTLTSDGYRNAECTFDN